MRASSHCARRGDTTAWRRFSGTRIPSWRILAVVKGTSDTSTLADRDLSSFSRSVASSAVKPFRTKVLVARIADRCPWWRPNCTGEERRDVVSGSGAATDSASEKNFEASAPSLLVSLSWSASLPPSPRHRFCPRKSPRPRCRHQSQPRPQSATTAGPRTRGVVEGHDPTCRVESKGVPYRLRPPRFRDARQVERHRHGVEQREGFAVE